MGSAVKGIRSTSLARRSLLAKPGSMARQSKVSAAQASFRSCSACGLCWGAMYDFLADPAVSLAGYQVNFERLSSGFFLFNHLTPDCRTTLAVPVGTFRELYAGPVFKKRLETTTKCPGYCQKRNVFKACPARCECAYVREILHIVENWPKKKAG